MDESRDPSVSAPLSMPKLNPPSRWPLVEELADPHAVTRRATAKDNIQSWRIFSPYLYGVSPQALRRANP
jgi:hypothetical protein